MAAASARRTKIIATLGPATSSHERITALVHAGMDCARLNFSHGTHDQHAEALCTVRAVAEEVGRPVAVMADLQGPKLRVGALAEPVVLERGSHVDVVPGDAAVDGELPVSPSVIAEVLQPGHEILIDDGLVRLQVESVRSGRAHCAVVEGGRVSSHKGVNLPGVPVPIPSLTRKDLADLEFALEQEVDFVALSFVRSAADVRDLRGLIDQAGSHAGVVAKVEKAEAVEALDASVVANAVLDGTSALMLSQETAIGEYPVAAVAYMDRLARAVEPSLDYRHQLPEASEEPTIGRAMSNAACDLAEALGATAILVPTFTGKTASAVARLRPRRPVFGLTHHRYALQQMALEWGVTPLEIPACENVEELWSRSLEAVRAAGLVGKGDRVVITPRTLVNVPGTTNVIKVEVA